MNWSFDARTIAPWQQVQEPAKPDFADNEDLKQAYGIELGKGLDAFNAAMQVFSEMPKALWASLNWFRDPFVIAAKDAYLKGLKKAEKPLDKEELLAEVLTTAKNCLEDKDRVAALKLYSDICGFTGNKLDVNVPINNTINNTTKIVLVKGSEERAKVIDQVPVDTNSKSKIQNNAIPQLKLVGGSR